MGKNKKISRRKFIKDTSLMGFGLALTPSLSRIKASANSTRLVVANHDEATIGFNINREIVKQLVNNGIMQYTGKNTIAKAWGSILPSFSPNDIVAIKVNCINSLLFSHSEIIDAIIQGLISAGVKDNNIIVWDRTNHELIRTGYYHNAGDRGVRYFGTDEKGWGYNKQIQFSNKTVRLSKLITESNHLINVPVLKNHETAGVTIGMKNHYGSIDNPGILHENQCDPYIAELNNIPEIRDKTRLTILDALFGIYAGGPGGEPQFVYNSIIIGQDPVAMDYNAWKIIESERQKHGLRLPQPKYIQTAERFGLGTNNPNNIIIEKIDLNRRVNLG